MSLIAELKRRNVFKVGAAYLALAWVVVQATGAIVPALNLPATLVPTVVWIGVIGFPCVLIFAWVYELTPEGLKRESEVDRSKSITHVTSKRLEYLIIALMVVGIGLAVLQYVRPPSASTAVEAAATVPTPEAEPAAPASPAAVPVPAQAALDEKSIAVLPFVNMSSDKEQEYFSDGMSEELLNLLAHAPDLKVIARTSSFAFKGTNTPIAEIAKQLGVAHVLEGSVRKAGNTVRITAQLIRAGDSTHLWSETYDRPLDDIFAVQDEISGAVVEQLRIKLLGEAPKAKPVNPEAYALYLQARQLNRQGTPEGFEQAIELLQQALSLDSGYAAAWGELSTVYNNQAVLGLRPIDEAYSLARDAVDKTLANDPEFALAHVVLGTIAEVHDGDPAAAAPHFLRAVKLEPTDSRIIKNAADFAVVLGRQDTAIEMLQWATARDPLSAYGHYGLGDAYFDAGRFDDAIASYRASQRLAPGAGAPQALIAVALLLKGESEAALVEALKVTDESLRLLNLYMIYHQLGRMGESEATLAELISKYEKQWPADIAGVYAYRGEADRAFDWLRKAAAVRGQFSYVAFSPIFANLHTDPRWLPFLRKIGRAPEQLAAIKFDVKLPQQ